MFVRNVLAITLGAIFTGEVRWTLEHILNKKSLALEDKLQLPPSVPKARIRAVEKEINKRIVHNDRASKRATYGRYSDEDKAKVRGYAAIHGVTTAMRHF